MFPAAHHHDIAADLAHSAILGIDDADLHAEGRASAGAMPAQPATAADLFAVVQDGRYRRQLGHAQACTNCVSGSVAMARSSSASFIGEAPNRARRSGDRSCAPIAGGRRSDAEELPSYHPWRAPFLERSPGRLVGAVQDALRRVRQHARLATA
jgi:hypothetical protein